MTIKYDESGNGIIAGLKISRKKLIKIAFDVLDEFPDTSVSDRGHLLYAACTMQQVALSQWAIDSKCGCLVGTMLMNEGKSWREVQTHINELVNARLIDLGERFDHLLTEHLVSKYGIGSGDGLFFYIDQSIIPVKD